MKRMHSTQTLALLAVLTSACVSTQERSQVGEREAFRVSNAAFRVPNLMQDSAVGSVIGEPAIGLKRRFGRPRIDLSESDARKLQFTSQTCVLDIYLYPLEIGAAPVATHVEVRDRQDGNTLAPEICIASIESQR